jgi:hypothetical protein
MPRRSSLPWLALLGFVLALPAAVRAQEDDTRRTFTLPHVLEVVGRAIDQPPPPELSAADRQNWDEQTEWLKSVRKRLQETGERLGLVPPARERGSGMATGRRTYEPIVIRRELEALQTTIQQESRKFQTLSNAQKARHDMAMNAVRNLKG